jgi:hypothetical protein
MKFPERWKKWEGVIQVTKMDGSLIKTVWRADGLNFRSERVLRGYLLNIGYDEQDADAFITSISTNVLSAQLAQFKEKGIEI